jgi:hypothetical protein
MTTRTIAAALGFAALALTSGTALAQTAAPSPAPAAAPDATPTKPAHPHHAAMRHTARGNATPVRARSQDAAVDDLNAQSLQAAQAGRDFTPSATPAPAPAPAAKKM